MLSSEEVMSLADQAQKKYPINEQSLMFAQMTGDRRVIEAETKQRVVWMINEAYKLGKESK